VNVSKRQRILLALLAPVLALWAIDAAVGPPKPSQGAASDSVPPPTDAAPTPSDLSSLFRTLAQNPADRAPLQLNNAARDLFALTETMRVALGQAAEAGRAGIPTSPADSPPQEPEGPFETRHTLYGTLVGPVPLALVDDLVVSRDALVGDHRLIQISRGYVVFRSPNGTYTRLNLAETSR
jgi:hypothetical protein